MGIPRSCVSIGRSMRGGVKSQRSAQEQRDKSLQLDHQDLDTRRGHL